MENTQVICAQDKVEKIAKIALWVLVGISIVVVALFLLVGYDTPYEENPKFKDPQLTDLLLIWTYILVIATSVVAVGAIAFTFANGGNKSKHEDTGMAGKAGLIAWGTLIVSLVAGVIVGITNKDESLIINGKEWHDAADTIVTETSMVSIIILTVVTVIVTAFSMATSSKKQ